MQNLENHQNGLQDQVRKYFEEHDIDTFKTDFDTYEEAQAKSEEINSGYGAISFVAEDRGKFSVKFRLHHLGQGFEEYKPAEQDDSDMAKAA